ncbi:MAG TPA: hypothetical protein VG963_15215 [Polyangiaceae bacterium]|nr:hypothetical protein [Polyangiaceae bacterium]
MKTLSERNEGSRQGAEKGRATMGGLRLLRRVAAGASLALLAGFAGCSSDDKTSDPPATCTDGGGPATGAADAHCGDTVQQIGMCVTDATDSDQAADNEKYTINFGSEADDDDCKYHVSFTNSCVTLNQPVTFTVKLTRKEDGAAATGATPDSPEVFFADDTNHVTPSNDFKAPEGPPGTYAISPIVFDRSGRWVVRFHFFETCSDVPEDSPHGHAAFYIDVP